MFAFRDDVAVCDATVKVTVSGPSPLFGLRLLIQDVDSLAVHAQPNGAVTVIVPVPPLWVNFGLSGATAGEQGAAFCVTVKVCPPIVSVPERGDVVLLAATVNWMGPD
jgi:hypothetical protein